MSVSAVVPLSSCGSETGDTTLSDDNTSETTPTAATTAGRNPSVESIEQTVARIRGLPAPVDLPVSYVNREQLQADLADQISEAYPQQKIGPEEQVLKYLGLIEKNTDLLAEVKSALGEGIIGYYDDKTKQLKVVSNTQAITPLNEITLSHEITHAVQDQNFDLARLTGDSGGGNSDQDLAVLSLVEGDSTLVEQEYTTLVMSGMDLAGALLGSLGSLGATAGSPPYLMHSIEFPYLAGADFVTELYSQNGWESVNAAYDHPPQSTEQVLHPEKYLRGEAPVEVTIPDLSGVTGDGWSALDEDTVGEFDVRELIGKWLPAARARVAAAGWGGGSYRYFKKDGQPLLVVSLVWDTGQDADEFLAAMKDCLAKRYNAGFAGGPDVPVMAIPDGAWALAQSGKNTVMVLAPDPVLADSVAAASLP